MNADNGGPAFPVNNIAESKTGEYVQLAVQSGMTLRDWFAGMALPAIISGNTEWAKLGGKPKLATIAEDTYKIADAMIAEREK